MGSCEHDFQLHPESEDFGVCSSCGAEVSDGPIHSVFAVMHVEGCVSVDAVTEGWTDEELAKLAAGEEEALDELKGQAEALILRNPDDVDTVSLEVRRA